MQHIRAHVLVCGGTGCKANGSKEIQLTFARELQKFGLQDEVMVVETGCHGFCEHGPLVIVYPEGTFYCGVKPEDVKTIVEEHLYKGRIVQRLLYREPINQEQVPRYSEIGFYKKQHRLVLANCGAINPEAIEEYIAVGGYEALAKAVTQMTPQEVVDEVKKSGLRGRGGGGFPTGMKWQFAKNSESDKKYVICNADEGDPGAFMDRSVLEGDPHRVLEGMAICGYAMGADEGYIYVRAEYPLAIKASFSASDRKLTIALYGVPILKEGVKIRMSSEKTGEIDPPSAVYTEDGSLQPGQEVQTKAATPGSRWSTDLVTYENDKEVSREFFHNSSYRGKAAQIKRNSSATVATNTTETTAAAESTAAETNAANEGTAAHETTTAAPSSPGGETKAPTTTAAESNEGPQETTPEPEETNPVVEANGPGSN